MVIDAKYRKIKVCILPGTEESERPTPYDLILLEHRFQMRGDGKSEYSIGLCYWYSKTPVNLC